jgi:adenine-specific DNA-methyltransferase
VSRAYSSEKRKALGAFYTDEAVARFLVEWGLRRGRCEAVLDPSAGDGRFLAVAAERGVSRVVACDVDPEALAATRRRLTASGPLTDCIAGDFFALDPAAVEPVDLVVGNPPFIRYQRFTGRSRSLALASARRLGVELSQLTSSWAPFILHALRFLRPGGGLAMVVPAEILQTQYGLATLRALLARFGEVKLIAFERNFFADAQEEACLLLAAEFGAASEEVGLTPLTAVDDLARWSDDGRLPGAVRVAVAPGSVVRFSEAFLTPAERRSWRRLQRHTAVRSVASLARVTNGYVSGANDFFHRTRAEAEAEGLPPTWLVPVARSSRSLTGLTLTRGDLAALEERGAGHHLVVPRRDLFDAHGEALERFVAEGQRLGVQQHFKCRTRSPWWQVPGLLKADLLVSYMVGRTPRAAINRAGAHYANSLHGLRLNEPAAAELLAVSFYSSLTLLSLEIEGRSYGGGILKLEPRELDRVLVAWPEIEPARLQRLVGEVDGLLRGGRYSEAVERVDEELLVRGMKVEPADLKRLRSGRERLLQRRIGRGRKGRGRADR